MIEHLSGIVLKKLSQKLIIDVRGVGYGVEMPLTSAFLAVETGASVSLWVYTRVREEELRLYGFFSASTRSVFELLLQVSGVGPKVALAILSTLSLDDLTKAVEYKQSEFLEGVPGIGKRTAEKILLELQTKKDKLLILSSEETGTANREGGLRPLIGESSIESSRGGSSVMIDLKSALLNLGFSEKEVALALSGIDKNQQTQELQSLIKLALSHLGQQRTKPTTTDSSHLQRLF